MSLQLISPKIQRNFNKHVTPLRFGSKLAQYKNFFEGEGGYLACLSRPLGLNPTVKAAGTFHYR